MDRNPFSVRTMYDYSHLWEERNLKRFWISQLQYTCITQGFYAILLIFSIVIDFLHFFFFKSVTYISGERSSNHGRTEHQGWNKQLNNLLTQISSSWIIAWLGTQISWLGPLNNTCYTWREVVLKFTWGFHIYSFKFLCKIRNTSRRKAFLYVKAPLQVTF